MTKGGGSKKKQGKTLLESGKGLLELLQDFAQLFIFALQSLILFLKISM
jgi:hypothetical protein